MYPLPFHIRCLPHHLQHPFRTIRPRRPTALRYVNDEYQFFIDNNIVHTQNAAGGLARGSGGQIGIGAREDGVEKANADFGVVRLYKRALTDDEMTLNFGFDKGRFGK